MTLVVSWHGKRKQEFLTANHHTLVNNQSIVLALEEAARFLIDTQAQLLSPVSYGCICWNLSKHITHELIQDIENLNNLP